MCPAYIHIKTRNLPTASQPTCSILEVECVAVSPEVPNQPVVVGPPVYIDAVSHSDSSLVPCEGLVELQHPRRLKQNPEQELGVWCWF